MCPTVSSTVLHTDRTDDRYDEDYDDDYGDGDGDGGDDDDGEVVKLESNLLQPRGLFSGSCNKRCNFPQPDEILG